QHRGSREVRDREHRAEHGLKAFVRPSALRLLNHQELIVGRLLNLDQVRHLRDFLDVSEEFSDPLATGKCLLRHRGLSFRRSFKERTVRKTVATIPRVEFRSISRPEAQLQGASPEFVLQTFKTQNDARGAETHPPVQTMSSRTAKARNCPSPDGLMGRSAG